LLIKDDLGKVKKMKEFKAGKSINQGYSKGFQLNFINKEFV
jgi:hypothetical protein|tara:strand:+ start:458 stop:580 length:123 start_codon:yes stop_codon:yes gene_type:complete